MIKSRTAEIEDFGTIAINGKYSEDAATIMISGVTLPRVNGFKPLNDAIWPCLRKRIAEKLGVDVVGWFNCAEGYIECQFWLNSEGRNHIACTLKSDRPFSESVSYKIGEHAYRGMFIDSLEAQVNLLQTVLVKFVKAKHNGLADYQALADRVAAGETIAPETCKNMLQAFLRTAGYRTESDELRNLEEEKRAKQRAEKTKAAAKANRQAAESNHDSQRVFDRLHQLAKS